MQVSGDSNSGMIERCAQKAFETFTTRFTSGAECHGNKPPHDWSKLPEHFREHWRNVARATLDVARRYASHAT